MFKNMLKFQFWQKSVNSASLSEGKRQKQNQTSL